MPKIAVCDDEKTYWDNLCAMLESYALVNGEELSVECFSEPSVLLDKIERGVWHDVYLLDIYMPGVSGMSVATELRSAGVRSPIIFLTSSTEHAVEAFGVDATHYLLKPYRKEQLFEAMNKAVERISTHAGEQSIVLKIDGDYTNILLSDLLYCEADGNYQRLFLKNGKEVYVRITASELYALLDSSFHRCGRSYMINLNHLSKVSASAAFLKNGVELPLPHSAVASLRTAFFHHFH